jgi:hypothetical protein
LPFESRSPAAQAPLTAQRKSPLARALYWREGVLRIFTAKPRQYWLRS